MTYRQQTGLWFFISGVLILSLWVLAYPVTNWAYDLGLLSFKYGVFTNEQLFLLGGAGVVSLRMASLTGIPFLITGLAQIIIGIDKKKTKKKNKK
jgi:hypothetical protein